MIAAQAGPGRLRRRGPRPIGLHLMLSALRWSGLPIASMLSSGAWPGLNPQAANLQVANPQAAMLAAAAGPRLAALASRLAASAPRGADPLGFPAAVLAELARADRAMLAGIAAYRRHEAERSLLDPPTLWAEGGSRLLDFARRSGRLPAVLVVPSLVNRATVLDLDEGASLMRGLASLGTRPLLLDWGWPGELERRFTLTDYVAGRLERALSEAVRVTDGPVVLLGYCMGGLLALAVAQRRPDQVRGLGLLATPWEFHAGEPDRPRLVQAMLPALEPFLAQGTLPVDLLQTLFALLDPFGVAAKFRAFARLDPLHPRARRFVLIEDWLNDGVPLAAPVARETLGGWYGRNEPARLEWRIAGEAVDPRRIAAPSFLALPSRDRIVPAASAEPLARLLPGALLHRARAGHVGMVAGERAEAELWRPLAAWVRAL